MAQLNCLRLRLRTLDFVDEHVMSQGVWIFENSRGGAFLSTFKSLELSPRRPRDLSVDVAQFNSGQANSNELFVASLRASLT